MIVKMELYILKSSGADFRKKLAGVLHDLGYMPTKADPGVWIKPTMNPDSSEYYEIVLFYIGDVLVISDDLTKKIDGFKSVFK